MKLAEALVLRKHLEAKVKQLEPIKLQGDRGLFEIQTTRKQINETTDEVTTQLPKITLKEITTEYNKYSKALRELDTAIQQTNWQADLSAKVSLVGIEV